MNLFLFNSNQSKEFVTTKQLAEILGVDVDTVNNTVRKIGFSDVLRKGIECTFHTLKINSKMRWGNKLVPHKERGTV